MFKKLPSASSRRATSWPREGSPSHLSRGWVVHNLELQDFLVAHVRQQLRTAAAVAIHSNHAVVRCHGRIRILRVPLVNFPIGDVVDPKAEASALVLDEDAEVSAFGQVNHALFRPHEGNRELIMLFQQDLRQLAACPRDAIDADNTVEGPDLEGRIAGGVPSSGQPSVNLLHDADVLVRQIQDHAGLHDASLDHAFMQLHHEGVLRQHRLGGRKAFLDHRTINHRLVLGSRPNAACSTRHDLEGNADLFGAR
mmetsp:Transcript_134280/g.189770  ORF Transcript_134280/g.189770 Transcript_134280/m.189770 type:complete len:253 (+) Transcript_134280:222-980(+)